MVEFTYNISQPLYLTACHNKSQPQRLRDQPQHRRATGGRRDPDPAEAGSGPAQGEEDQDG